MADDTIDYPALVQTAMLGVVRGVLARAAESGLPGEHHFYIGFATGHAGVRLAPRLRTRFPDEMTVVLQHQFRDLEVHDDRFAVTLRFGGRPERLTIPFDAITSFGDPAADFGLRFQPPGAEASEPGVDSANAAPAAEAPRGAAAEDSAAEDGAPDGVAAGGGETVVAVDFMRRKVADGRKRQ